MNIYVAGALNNEEILKVYKFIKEELSKQGHIVKTPLDTIEFCKTHNCKERFDKAMQEIGEADLVIAEVSTPSSGQGFELGTLYARGFKNVVLITSCSTYSSGILTGAFGEPIKYRLNNLPKLLLQLKKRL